MGAWAWCPPAMCSRRLSRQQQKQQQPGEAGLSRCERNATMGSLDIGRMTNDDLMQQQPPHLTRFSRERSYVPSPNQPTDLATHRLFCVVDHTHIL